MTLGEQRVRTDFNVSKSDTVTQIKQKTAELINYCTDIMIDRAKYITSVKQDAEVLTEETGNQLDVDTSEIMRLVEFAQKSLEEGAMWAVKAATFK